MIVTIVFMNSGDENPLKIMRMALRQIGSAACGVVVWIAEYGT
jgi:hypothetical protein